MDNLLAIGVGLGLRALIDSVTNHNHRVDGSLVGLWEGAVLRHFISKYPSSLDPYVAYSFRLLVDLLWTSNWMRLFVVVLWTFMGILLSDVGLDLATDRRFRRLMRGIRHTIIHPLLRQSSQRRTSPSTPTSRVQFFQIPATTSTTSTVRSPAVRSPSPTNVAVPTRSGATTPVIPRRPALRVPGSFTDRSETDTDAGRGSSVASHPESSTSRSSRTHSVTFSEPPVSQTHNPGHKPQQLAKRFTPTPSATYLPIGNRIPLPLIPLPNSPPSSVSGSSSSIHNVPPSIPPILVPHRTPSPDLEYAAIPAIPDNIEQINPVRDVPSDDERSVRSSLRERSRLTTPDLDRPRIDVHSPEPIKSGLTTPADRPSTPRDAVGVVEEGAHTPSIATADLSDVTPIPIPMRYSQHVFRDDDAEQLKASLLNPESLPDINTPQPSPGLNPPVQYLPSPEDEKHPIIRMPVPEVVPASDVGASRVSVSEQPPPYEQTPGEADEENTPAGSVISNAGDRQALVQRAETLRKTADVTDKRRAQLKQELQEARRNRDHWKVFRLKHEVDRAEKETRELHAKAARRFYQAHNLKPAPQTIDVHRLKVPEAIEKVEQALYDAIVTNTPELRIITGKGNHSKNGIPALKLAIIGAMSDYHIDANTDPNNSGILIIHPPANPALGAGPSTSS